MPLIDPLAVARPPRARAIDPAILSIEPANDPAPPVAANDEVIRTVSPAQREFEQMAARAHTPADLANAFTTTLERQFGPAPQQDQTLDAAFRSMRGGGLAQPTRSPVEQPKAEIKAPEATKKAEEKPEEPKPKAPEKQAVQATVQHQPQAIHDRSVSVAQLLSESDMPPTLSGPYRQAVAAAQDHAELRAGFEARWGQVTEFAEMHGLDKINQSPELRQQLQTKIEEGGGMQAYKADAEVLQRAAITAGKTIKQAGAQLDDYVSRHGLDDSAREAADGIEAMGGSASRQIPQPQTDAQGQITTVEDAAKKVYEMIKKALEALKNLFRKNEPIKPS